MENATTTDSTSLEAPNNVNTSAPVAKKRTSKWVVVGAPVLAVALLAYGYHAGYLQKITGKTTAAVTAYLPGADKPAGTQVKLTLAREAFAAGNINAAIDAYHAFINDNPGDITAHGELGNVYYSAGATVEAARVYFEAASLAIEKGDLDTAEALMPVISEGSPMLANQLSDKLFSAHAKAADQRTAELDRQFEADKQKFDQQMQQSAPQLAQPQVPQSK
ncbi:MAG TPA: hypothetical protein DEO88_18070 [Syntrophobacteraceae bacterium]|nr:hypothetical protein [Syntrophobacteraceae bacterium]